MAFALSTAHQIGLALTGAAFIAFALVSSFVLAKRNPGFPGRHRNIYLVVCVAFFLAMLAAVLVFGREEPASEAATATTTTPKLPAGDPAAGKAQFAASGCSACHTFKPAGSHGTIGPDLDKLKASAATAGQPLDAFIATSIMDPNAYIAPGYKAGIMPKFPFNQKQIANLVAFLSSGQ